MIFTEEDIIEYKHLVKARFNKDISDAEALEDALSLIQFVKITQKHIPKQVYEQFKKEDIKIKN